MTTPASIRLRPATIDDAEAMARLHARAFTRERPWSAEEIASLLRAPSCRGLALDRGDGPIGFVLSMLTEREGEILTLAVDPEHRRRGHGAQLLSAALADMAMTGIKRVVLEVAEDNAAARALYEAHGFAVAGRRPRYYARRDDARVDAIVMIQVFAAGCGCDD